jgi:ABC-type nitrate/sulfonate/bicarbonate transport system substrate-binding protein
MLTLTQPGDVLILQTGRGVKIHAVGRVMRGGQQDFHHVEPAPVYIADLKGATICVSLLCGWE